MELLAIIIAIVSLFALIGAGYAARRSGILDGDRVHLISHVLVNIALPGAHPQQHAGTGYHKDHRYR